MANKGARGSSNYNCDRSYSYLIGWVCSYSPFSRHWGCRVAHTSTRMQRRAGLRLHGHNLHEAEKFHVCLQSWEPRRLNVQKLGLVNRCKSSGPRMPCMDGTLVLKNYNLLTRFQKHYSQLDCSTARGHARGLHKGCLLRWWQI